jgi:effector-binding domain-containing protein
MDKLRFNKSVFALVILALCFACNQAVPTSSETVKKDSTNVVEQKEVFPVWQDSIADNTKGIIGVFEVPEILSLCKLDSAPMQDVSKKIIKNFSLLEKDLQEIGCKLGPYQGIIYYNNDPANFKFECFLCIKNTPSKKPKYSQPVILESSKMLIYNYYGPYENIASIYPEIKQYSVENKFVQIGQMRELYPISQSAENDPNKRLTRIMVPVVRVVKKSIERQKQ